jgi:lysophospholipase L1-like esterase
MIVVIDRLQVNTHQSVYLPKKTVELFTHLSYEACAEKIQYRHNLVTMGSCFADRMGGRLQEAKFHCLSNPFGVVFNPISIGRLVSLATTEFFFLNDEHIVEREDYFFHLDTHSELGAPTKEELVYLLQEKTSILKKALSEADWLIITFGTAYVYRYKPSDTLVANCQKLPAAQFTKETLTASQISAYWKDLIGDLRKINPQIKFIFTVSPVRHIKDGLVANSLSKAILRVASDELCQSAEQVYYFPSFELMMDEMRDYRFYAEDMIHPNKVAEDRIWEAFTQTYLHNDAQKLLKEWGQVQKALQHKAFRSDTPSHQQFLSNTLAKLLSLSEQLEVDKEIALVRSQLLTRAD